MAPRSSAASGTGALDVLGRTRYALLTTFRKDGTPVATPVWIVRRGDELLVWTNPEAGKVKRIRRNPAVTLVPCGMHGEPLSGTAVTGRAEMVPGGPAVIDGIFDLLIDKYGWQGRITRIPDRLGRLIGREPQPAAAMSIVLDPVG
ncbi:PPOX class F420-dependent oxidoreductase [Nakamurella sp. YIM 132087]|uniref:PPOX class F420-dependent oxidoreductase n=1 Tax=Nakamurella alba TaxID=2665158 RepID=A0A7K1FJM6_9ACTN|nr:PPOX class F420-dependent oxidoreductase [Nakamurella alba]MTD13639.1 PPOX class F420-dependent oxidoreductase [Nakamurella alba]